MFAASVVVIFAAPVAPAPRPVTPYRVFKPILSDWRPALWDVKPIPMLYYPGPNAGGEYDRVAGELRAAERQAEDVRAQLKTDPGSAELRRRLLGLEKRIELKRQELVPFWTRVLR